MFPPTLLPIEVDKSNGIENISLRELSFIGLVYRENAVLKLIRIEIYSRPDGDAVAIEIKRLVRRELLLGLKERGGQRRFIR
jgi:hypothetical protein